nr:hypothetical protein [Tanacetum cinerariifolium]
MDNKREGTNRRKEREDVGKFDGHGNECKRAGTTGSPKAISSPLVSPTATVNMPPLGPFAGKHDELLSGMTNDDRMETMDALGTICNSIEADNPIVRSVNINTKSTSYAKAAGSRAKDQLKVKFNLRPLVVDPVFDGVNISIPCGLEAVLEGGPWLIRKSPIILKKWSMDTRLLKEELTRIPLWIKLHDVPIQVFEDDSTSLIATFIGKPVMLDSYTSSMCNDSPPKCDICKIFGHVHDHYPKKVVSPPIVITSNVVTPTVEKANDGFQKNVRYKPKAPTSAPKKGATNVGNASNSSCTLKNTDTSIDNDNITSSNSFSVLNVEDEEEEEDVENVYVKWLTYLLIQKPVEVHLSWLLLVSLSYGFIKRSFI